MSYSFDVVADSKKNAMQKVNKEHAPAVVKAMLHEAIRSLHVPSDKKVAILVKAQGHMPDEYDEGGQSHGYSDTSSVMMRMID